jgi:hypothetical protein
MPDTFCDISCQAVPAEDCGCCWGFGGAVELFPCKRGCGEPVGGQVQFGVIDDAYRSMLVTVKGVEAYFSSQHKKAMRKRSLLP